MASPSCPSACRWRSATVSPASSGLHASASPPRSSSIPVAGLRGLDLIPELIHLLQRRIHRRPAFGAHRSFDAAKSPNEFGVGIAQGSFRIELEMARDIRHDEKQIAELLGDLLRSAGSVVRLPAG